MRCEHARSCARVPDSFGSAYSAAAQPLDQPDAVRRHPGPDHPVGAAARRQALSVEAALRQPRAHRFDVHAALVMHAEVLQRLDDVVRCLPGHVGGDEVAHRSKRGPSQDREATDGGIVGQESEHVIGQLGGYRDTQVRHPRDVPQPRYRGGCVLSPPTAVSGRAGCVVADVVRHPRGDRGGGT